MTKRSSTARSYPVRIPRVAVGPLTPTVLGECSRWLSVQGYSAGSAAGIVNLLERLSMWMQVVGAGLGDRRGAPGHREVGRRRLSIHL